jgi:hypothetical protein
VAALFVAMLLGPVQLAWAAPQDTTGTVELSNTLSYGNTAYGIDYSYPSTAQVGQNLTISVTLHVKALNGLIEYVWGYRIYAFVYIGAQLVQETSLTSTLKSPYLYPGASWGPNSILIPLSANATGISKGTSANATVSFELQDQLYVNAGNGKAYEAEPPMQGSAGSLTIENGATPQSTPAASTPYVAYALVACGAVLMLAAAVMPRGPRSRTGGNTA